MSRSSSRVACSRPAGPTRPPSPDSGSSPAARSRRRRPLERAAVREIEEELGCVVEVTGELDGRSRIADDLELRVVLARLVDGDPVPHEHDAVRWLRAAELDEVSWAGADVPFLDVLRDLPGLRGDG